MTKAPLVATSILGILCLSACGGGDSQQPVAAQLSAESVPTDVCIAMAGGDGMVGGLQMDLTWDSACMTAVRAGGTAVQCTSNPSTGESVYTALLSGALMRAIFFSMSNQDPIPDGELFCCKFAVSASPADSCCSVKIANLILASPTGGRLYLSDLNMTVQASVGGAACDVSTPEEPIPATGSPPVM
jgi:hypothetical protein